jgi:hypothetical protein
VLSRFHVLTSKSAGVPIDQFRNEIDPAVEARVRREFNTHQMLIAAVYQYMTMGCTGRSISLDLFDYIISSVCAYLRSHHVIQGSRNRPVEKIRQFCRICTIEKAITEVVYAPGGKWYGKPWNPECMKDIARHCFAEEQQCITAITWMSNELITDDWHIVMCALCAMVGIRNDSSDVIDTYEMYVRDKDIRPRVRLKYNPLHDKGRPQDQPKHLVDLNYFMIPGQFDTICSQISEMTNPHMAPDMVKNVLLGLQQHMFQPAGGAYKPVNPTTMVNHNLEPTDKEVLMRDSILTSIEKQKHELLLNDHRKYIELEKTLQEDAYQRIVQSVQEKKVVNGTVTYQQLTIQGVYATYMSMVHDELHIPPGYSAKIIELMDNEFIWEWGTPKKYWRAQQDATGKRPCKDDLPRTPDQIPVITITKRGAHAQVCFAPQAINMFDRKIILEALEQAIICETTKPGKRLLGWPDARDNTKFSTVSWSREFIDTFLSMVPPERRTHILYPRRGYIDDDIANVIYPTTTVDNQDRQTMEKLNNLNKWAAIQHHWRCVSPFDAPLHDEAFVDREYNRQVALKAPGTEKHGKTNYPLVFANILENLEENQWGKSTIVSFSRADREKLAKLRK